MNGDRIPYVGEGADGARRSAEIDRSEVDGLALDDDRRDYLLASAAAWERQAEEIDQLHRATPTHPERTDA